MLIRIANQITLDDIRRCPQGILSASLFWLIVAAFENFLLDLPEVLQTYEGAVYRIDAIWKNLPVERILSESMPTTRAEAMTIQ